MRKSARDIPSLSASFPGMLAQYTHAVETALRSAVPEDNGPLYQALRYHMGWADENGMPITGAGGKRFRPTLCLMACEAVGGSPQVAMPAAAAVELVHNFSLVHDDIQDRDRERHHRPTVWALWGESQALKVGDTLYALACQTVLDLAQHNVAPERVLQASVRLTQSSLEMMQGQYLDLEFERRMDVTTQEYLDMTVRKTGALIACAMEMGALIGSGDPATVSIVAQSGRYIGQLFQIRDDVLGVWGDVATTGKAIDSDIQRRKKTFPVVHALQHATGAEATALRRLYRKERFSGNDVQQVLEVLETTGARKEADARATRLAHQALESLQLAELSPEHSRDWEELVSFLLFRER